MTELPVIDTTRCTGCGECVEVCPTECLAMLGRGPWLARPRDCVACSACAYICPTNAIVIKSVDAPTGR